MHAMTFKKGPELYTLSSVIVSTFQALSHVYSWRGKSNVTVGKLLIDLWRKDEMSLGVARTPQWFIKGWATLF
jgi:hypothetical protein